MLSRTRANLVHEARLSLYKLAGIQTAIDEQERRTLEDHMGFRGQWDEHRRFQLDFAKRMGLLKTSRLIEIGCGPLTLGLPAIEYLAPGGYIGIDVRPVVLNLGWQQIGKYKLAEKNPRLVCSRSFGAEELPADLKADRMWSFSVLYHLTDDLIDQCLAQVARRLAPGGAYIANINPQQAESTWLQFPFNARSVSFYRSLAEKHGLKVTELGTLESQGFKLEAIEKVNILLRFELA